MINENYFDKILKNLSEEERKNLYEKFSRVLYISDEEKLEQIETENEKNKDYLVKSYKLTILDSIVIFFNSLFGYFDVEKYILKKEIKKITKILNKNFNYYNLSDNSLNLSFFNNFFYIVNFISKYNDFLKYFCQGFKEKIIKEKILLYFLELSYDETIKKKLENLSDKNIEKYIYEDPNYKKRFFELKKDIINSLKGKIENKFNQKMNLFYNLINFFNVDLNFLCEYIKKFEIKVPLEQIKDHFAFFLKKILQFPFENEDVIEILKEMISFYKNIQFDFNIDELDVDQLVDSILFYIKDEKALCLLKIIYFNPVYEYELVRFKLDFFKEAIKLLDSYYEKKIIDIEKELKQKERENLLKQVHELNLKQYNFINIDKKFNDFLSEFNLPSINFIEKLEFITSFYFYMWQTFFSSRLQKILKERFYLFEKNHIDSIYDSIKTIDKTQFIIESLEEKARNLKLMISRELKDKNYPHESEKFRYIINNINIFNESVNEFCNNFIKSIDNIDKNLMFNQSDEFILFFRKELEKYLNILKLF